MDPSGDNHGIWMIMIYNVKGVNNKNYEWINHVKEQK